VGTESKGRPVQDFLEILSQQRAILVGGQAVNLRAVHYQSRSPELQALAPFVSQDCDLLGDAGTLQDLKIITGAEPKRTRAGTASPVVGFASRSETCIISKRVSNNKSAASAAQLPRSRVGDGRASNCAKHIGEGVTHQALVGVATTFFK